MPKYRIKLSDPNEFYDTLYAEFGADNRPPHGTPAQWMATTFRDLKKAKRMLRRALMHKHDSILERKTLTDRKILGIFPTYTWERMDLDYEKIRDWRPPPPPPPSKPPLPPQRQYG